MQTPDEIIHQPVRLRIMAALNTLQSGQWLEFVALRAIVQATDGNLGAHLGTLESAGYVVVKKAFVGRKPRTRICLSRLGREAFSRYVSTLQATLAPGSRGAEDADDGWCRSSTRSPPDHSNDKNNKARTIQTSVQSPLRGWQARLRWLALLCLMAVSAASAGLVLAQSTTEPTATEQSAEPVMAAPVTAAELPGERFGVREMFTQADLVVKSVMILLVLMSLLTWAILFEKLMTFAGARSRNRRFL